MGEQELLKMQQRKKFVIKFCYWKVIAACIYTVLKYLLPMLSPFVLPDPSGTELLEGSFESILKSLSSGIISLSNTVLSAVAGFAAKIHGTFMRQSLQSALQRASMTYLASSMLPSAQDIIFLEYRSIMLVR